MLLTVLGVSNISRMLSVVIICGQEVKVPIVLRCFTIVEIFTAMEIVENFPVAVLMFVENGIIKVNGKDGNEENYKIPHFVS